MLRLLGYFALVFVVMIVLRQVPVVGGLFRIPFLGFFLAVVVVGYAAERLGTSTLNRRRFQRMQHDLGRVDTPHNRGKLGTLLVTQQRFRQALPHLEAAAAGEPESAEWHYRLGCAQLGAGHNEQAAASLTTATQLNEEHAYGAALLRLVEALHADGEFEQALTQVERFERGHGATAESAYRRGLALKALGRKDAAAEAFDEVSQLASSAAKYQRAEARKFALRAFFSRVTG